MRSSTRIYLIDVDRQYQAYKNVYLVAHQSRLRKETSQIIKHIFFMFNEKNMLFKNFYSISTLKLLLPSHIKYCPRTTINQFLKTFSNLFFQSFSLVRLPNFSFFSNKKREKSSFGSCNFSFHFFFISFTILAL